MTSSDNFRKYFGQGKELEDLLETQLTYNKVPHREVTDLEEQHSGDFYLEGEGVYLEAKNDLLFSKYGNLYMEIAEIRDENAPKNPETIKAIGVLKHAAKEPTVIVQQIAADRFIVYSCRKAVIAMMKELYCFKWNEKADSKMKRLDKTNVAMLWKNAMQGVSPRMDDTFHWVDSTLLIDTIKQVAKEEKASKKASPKALLTLAKARGRVEDWREKGWSKYSYSVDGL